ncbi:hypothetical protein BDZ91DRAFT_739044 [Kalaharituber pfeilii]|nr:hypothetical protein BDZ91DRAFT_739044 [Kalaharituber pfeilii]
MNTTLDTDAPPPPYSYSPPPNHQHQCNVQSPSVASPGGVRDPSRPPPLPPRTPSFATPVSTALSPSRPPPSPSAANYDYHTGLAYPHGRAEGLSSPGCDTFQQPSVSVTQRAEEECYLYPGSIRDPIDPRDVKDDKKPPLPPRRPTGNLVPPAEISTACTSGDVVAPVPKRPVDMRLGMGQVGQPGEGVYPSMDLSYDPRTRSTQSIPPVPPPHNPPLPSEQSKRLQQHPQELYIAHPPSPPPQGPRKRRLLLIYIHGFLGSTTSFNHFPSHLHNLLTYTLSMSCPMYTVHTKVYPRFKTRHPIAEAAEMFSQWLAEFEDEDEVPGRRVMNQGRHSEEVTDVILLGHSMGGLLAGEVVLLPTLHPVEGDNEQKRYRHRILGLVGFDAPFLGMHPGVVTSGLSSLFRPSPKGDKRKGTQNQAAPLSPTYDEGPSAEDLFLRKNPENFNTGLPPKQDSGNSGMRNFLNKHRGNIPGATVQYMLSHMEFAACLADPVGLSTRYKRLRSLEDGKEIIGGGDNITRLGGYRVRFVNYYTVCYGRPKDKDKEKAKIEESALPSATRPASMHLQSPPPHPASAHRRGESAPSIGTLSPTATTTTVPTVDKGLQSLTLDAHGVSPPSSSGGDGIATPRSSTSSRATPPPLSAHLQPPQSPQSQSEVAQSQKSTLQPQSPSKSQSLEQSQTTQPSLDIVAILNARSARYSLPPLPPAPVEPPLHPDLSHITDQKVQKAHMKESKRLWKEHFRQEKAHAKLVKDREKVLAKLEGKPCAVDHGKYKDKERLEKEKLEKEKLEKETLEKEKLYENMWKKDKVRKERRFCMIPKEAKYGDGGCTLEDRAEKSMDDTWVKVPMGNVDEVGAHCGLFMAGTEIFEPSSSSSSSKAIQQGGLDSMQETGFVGRTNSSGGSSFEGLSRKEVDEEKQELETKRRQYEKLVGDVAGHIETWLKEYVGVLEALEVAGQRTSVSYVDSKKEG